MESTVPSLFTEADDKAAALEWFAELGYTIAYGPTISPGELTAERVSIGGKGRPSSSATFG
jgi:hypothetical protein